MEIDPFGEWNNGEICNDAQIGDSYDPTYLLDLCAFPTPCTGFLEERRGKIGVLEVVR